MIDLRIHSSRHLEAKLVLPIPEDKPYSKDLNMYFFVPSQLNVNEATVGKEELLRKFNSHGRYTSPDFTLPELLDLENPNSPLNYLEGYSKQTISRTSEEENVIHEAQALVNSIRHESKQIISRVSNAVESKNKAALEWILENWNTSVHSLLSRFRVIMVQAEATLSPTNRIRIALCWADEAMSILAEKNAIEIHDLVTGFLASDCSYLTKINELRNEEVSYKLERNYKSASRIPEVFAYRQSVLKKWTQSVLYLIPQQTKGPKRIGSILAGAAAAIAMTFATLASIFAERFFLKNSLQWALIVIIAYVFKDRIKEGLKAIFNAFVPRLMADKVTVFKSPRTGRIICKNRDKLSFSTSKDVPYLINEARKDANNPFRDMLPPEDVVHYSRFVSFRRFKSADKKKTPWIRSLTTITRIRMDDFMKEMDDSPSDIVLIGEDDNENHQTAKRVYHIHLVIEELSAKKKIDSLQHYLIVMNREGIQRTELISSSGAENKKEISGL